MDSIMESLQLLADPDWIMKNGGLYLILCIIFIETGFFFGFFLPGDPLLFISGMLIAVVDTKLHPFNQELLNLFFWQILLLTSACAGYFVAYWFGKKFGPLIMRKDKDYWLLKRKHIFAAQEFYNKNGGFAVAIARFVPIARTFVPIIAGMFKMDFRKFSFYNLLGAFIWVIVLTSLGYALGGHPWINRNLEWTLLAIVGLASLPVIIKALFPRKPQTITVK